MVAPELAVPGKTTAVLITLHGPAGRQPLNVSLKLLPDDKADGNGQSQHLLETIQEIKGTFFKKHVCRLKITIESVIPIVIQQNPFILTRNAILLAKLFELSEILSRLLVRFDFARLRRAISSLFFVES